MSRPATTVSGGGAPWPSPPVKRWPAHLAVAAALAALLDDQLAALGQLGLFGLAAGLSSAWMDRLCGKAARPVKIAYFIVSLPVFLRLEDAARMEEEWPLTRLIYLVLLGGVYLLPFLPWGTLRDVRRITIVLAACFFYSATFFRTSWFLPALLTCAFALLIAFHSGRPRPRAEKSSAAVFRLATLQLVLMLLGGSVLFGCFPRGWFRSPSNAGRFGGGDAVNQSLANLPSSAQAGFSTRRDLLQLAHLLDFSRSSAEVLRIRLTVEQTGEPFYATNSLYLRASIFETYSRGRWTSGERPVTCRDGDDGKRDGWTWIEPPPGHASGPRIRQHIQMQPMDDACFSLPDPVAINYPVINVERRGVLLLPYKASIPWSYKVISELPVEAGHPALEAAPPRPAPEGWEPYLQIPSSLRPLLNRFKTRWDPQRGPASQARQISRFLQSQYKYGPTSFLPSGDTDPVRSFLTDSGRGYCTHFATAMALMARSIGLPARIATGFHFMGGPDPDGYYRIRDLNAHAWTEIYFPGHGWIIFDATPPASRPALEKMSEASRWLLALLRLGQVNNLFSEYDAPDQKAILIWGWQKVAIAMDWWRKPLSSPWTWAGFGLLSASVWAVFRQLPLRWRRRLLQTLSGQKAAGSVPFYEDLLWLLARHGPRKPPGLTGLEYAQAVTHQGAHPEVAGLTRQFYLVKYGGHILTPEERLEVQRRLATLESKL